MVYPTSDEALVDLGLPALQGLIITEKNVYLYVELEYHLGCIGGQQKSVVSIRTHLLFVLNLTRGILPRM